MARIPVYEQRTRLSGQVQGGQVTGQSAIAGAAAQLSQDIRQVGAQLAANEDARDRIEEQKTEDRAAVTVANVLSQGDVHWQQQYDERTKAWKPGDPDLREGISKDFEAWKAKTIKDLPTERSRQFFERIRFLIHLITPSQTIYWLLFACVAPLTPNHRDVIYITCCIGMAVTFLVRGSILKLYRALGRVLLTIWSRWDQSDRNDRNIV